MKHLFVARHGKYDYIEGIPRLNKEGIEQMKILGEKIKEIIGEGSIYLVSSTAPRALDSSKVLKSELGLSGFEELPYIWSGSNAGKESWERDYSKNRKNNLLNVVFERENYADGLVLVTHLEIVESLSSNFLKKVGEKGYPPSPTKGRAIHFDRERKTYSLIP
jgi:phosphohistidine phosphatase SixA